MNKSQTTYNMICFSIAGDNPYPIQRTQPTIILNSTITNPNSMDINKQTKTQEINIREEKWERQAQIDC